MATLSNTLKIPRCPHCSVDNPNFSNIAHFDTTTSEGTGRRIWRCYVCARCGGVVTASAGAVAAIIQEMFPSAPAVDAAIPARAGAYLKQAIETVHAPAGSIMLCASSVDAMLKAKKLTEGSLYSRLKLAVEQNILTPEMEQWAHEVRLEANDERHADEAAPLPITEEAKQCIEFTTALGQFLFVLPARVSRGLEAAKKKT